LGNEHTSKIEQLLPRQHPYGQALLEYDGSLHVEVPGRLAIEDMSDEDLKVLEYICWTVRLPAQENPKAKSRMSDGCRKLGT